MHLSNDTQDVSIGVKWPDTYLRQFSRWTKRELWWWSLICREI